MLFLSFDIYTLILLSISLLLTTLLFINDLIIIKTFRIDYILIFGLIISLSITNYGLDLSNYYIYIFGLFTVYIIIMYILSIIKTNRLYVISKVIKDTIKSDTSDFCFVVNKKKRIIDCSESLLKLANKDFKDIKKINSYSLLSKVLKIVKINDTDYSDGLLVNFIKEVDNSINNKVTYCFTCDIFIKGEINHYTGLIDPIYISSNYIASMINLYQDKMALIKKLNQNNQLLSKEIVDSKNVLHLLMSLSEGVVLYYDFTEKAYFTTDAFKDHVGLNKDSYTFEEFYYMIDEQSRNRYAEESKNVNSNYVNRIKFIININDCLYHAVEDSIYLTDKGKELVSIIHVTSRVNDDFDDGITSSIETSDLLKKLSELKFNTSINKALRNLEKAIEEANNDL